MMRRQRILAVGLSVALSALCGTARAQWGYGYYPYGYGGYGWGGWGGTLQGDIARGLGYFNMGAGVYNQQTAIARSINTDTAIRWNQYVYLSQQEATREYMARRNASLAKDRNAYESLLKRIQDNPTAADVDNGDALNAALDQLSDPRLHSSALRMAETPLSAKMIREIPFPQCRGSRGLQPHPAQGGLGVAGRPPRAPVRRRTGGFREARGRDSQGRHWKRPRSRPAI